MTKCKSFVLRTHSLLVPNATLNFDEDNTIIIPMAVLEDLKDYKGYPEDQKNAKLTLDYIESLGINKLVKDGVVQSNGSLLKIALDAADEEVKINNITLLDKRCFQVCLKLKKQNHNVVLISKNQIIRMKSDLLGIKAEEPKFEMFPPIKEQYKGQKEVYASNTAISKFYKEKN